MTDEQIIRFVQDIRDIGLFFQWQSALGDEFAQKIIDEIHAGKYGDRQGVWVQVCENLLPTLARRLSGKA